jgi:outer membrane protein assembly factor BamE
MRVVSTVLRSLFTLVGISMLSACAGFGVYKIDIQQGNLITQEQLAKVKVGMNRVDVRNTLGTPLLQDAFHANRWDYYFSDDRSTKYGPFGRETQRFQVTILFVDNKVSDIAGQASPVEILTGGGERRFTPNVLPPGVTPPKKP